jgi:hypothetical protein
LQFLYPALLVEQFGFGIGESLLHGFSIGEALLQVH